MPTYDYECSKCGVVFEVFQPITAPALKKLRKSDPRPCACNALISRLIGTGGGIIFKGSGFYQTDYRSEGYKKAAKADSESASPKSDSKKDGAKKSEAKKSPGSDKKDSGTKSGVDSS